MPRLLYLWWLRNGGWYISKPATSVFSEVKRLFLLMESGGFGERVIQRLCLIKPKWFVLLNTQVYFCRLTLFVPKFKSTYMPVLFVSAVNDDHTLGNVLQALWLKFLGKTNDYARTSVSCLVWVVFVIMRCFNMLIWIWTNWSKQRSTVVSAFCELKLPFLLMDSGGFDERHVVCFWLNKKEG